MPDDAVPAQPTAVEQPERAAAWTLLLRPGRFFRDRAEAFDGLGFWAAIWLLGVSRALDRLALRGASDGESDLLRAWSAYWAYALGAGLVVGIVALVLGGPWFHLRVRLCGAGRGRAGTSLRVFLLASLIASVTTIGLDLSATLRFDTPLHADDAEHWSAAVILLVAGAWSIVVAWRGALAVFAVGRWRAVLLFLLLPLLLLLGFRAAATPRVWRAGSRAPPAVDRAREHADPTFRFLFPGNWRTLPRDVSGGGATGGVEAPQDALLELEAYPSDASAASEVAATWRMFEDAGWELRAEAVPAWHRWGAHVGVGEERAGVLDGRAYRLRVFVTRPTRGWALEAREVVLAADVELVEPGLRLVRESLELTVDWAAPPDIAGARRFEHGFLSFPHPGNWRVVVDAESTMVAPYLHLEAPQDLVLQVLVYGRERSLEEELELTIEEFEDWGVPERGATFDSWGGLVGHGRRVSFRAGEAETRLWFFAAVLTGGRVLEVRAFHDPLDEKIVAAALELMASGISTAP